RNAVEAARQRLLQSGLAKSRDGGRLEWQPIRKGDTPLVQRLTSFEKFQIERFNATLLAEVVLPGALTVAAPPNYVDRRLSAPKTWRDVYHHDAAGQLTGWTRYDGPRVVEFTEEGLMVLEKDGAGRPV